MRLKGFSLLTEDVVDLGIPGDDADQLLNLGETLATGRDDFIVFVEGRIPLQKWSTP